MSPEKRSAVMARIKGRDTGPELQLAAAMRRAGLRWRSHDPSLPGTPDFVFRRLKVAVFVDGDFWHGWRLPLWKDKLTLAWADKIEHNRARDRRNHGRLRRLGWKVIRIWEHDVEKNTRAAAQRVLDAVCEARRRLGVV